MNIDHNVKILNDLFEKLKLKADIKRCKYENSFLICDILLNPGGTFRKFEKYSTEIALSLKALSEPLIYPITKEGIIRMEIMISAPAIIPFKEISGSKQFLCSEARLPLALGRSRDGQPLIADLAEMPHLLIGGATGSGKSILLHTIINSLLLKNVNLTLIDPKRVEFTYYDGLSNLFGPIAKDIETALHVLKSLIKEVDNRFIKLEKSGARDIGNFKGRMPYIVVVIDELADLMMVSKKEVQELICRLAQKSRACGIHIVAATQRPSVDVVTGLIKANFPSRLSCKVSASIDSRTILDKNGAEKLAGKGDAIIDCSAFNFKRFRGSFLTEQEIKNNAGSRKTIWSKIWNS